MRFHERLEAMEVEVTHLFAMVSEDLTHATAAVLASDASIVTVLTEREAVIGALQVELEDVVCTQIAQQAPVSRDLRFLLSVLRVVPELERSHDLVVHIAELAGQIPRGELPVECAEIISAMGSIGSRMWNEAADCWYRKDGTVAATLELADDQMDQLHDDLMRLLEAGVASLPVALTLTFVGRFYERLGDHAVNIARRVIYLSGLSRSG